MNLPANSTSRLLKHPNGQTTHVVVDDYTDPWTEPETILIQGGFARHSGFWYHWIPSLARHYRVVRRDTRGHGKSSAPGPEDDYAYTLDTILEEIVDTLQQLNLCKVHFIGESTSGMLGEAFAARFASRLHSLTIISSPTHLPAAALELFSFGYPTWPEACRQLGSRGWGERLARVPGTLSASDPEYEVWWLDQIAISSGEGLAGYAEFLSSFDGRPFLAQISVPMLILAPARSAATSLEEQLEIARQVKDSKLVVIHGRGHEIYGDKAGDCLAAVSEFLLEVELRSSLDVN
ncbi:Alpha/Beta hydrolase protein [Aspergillus cavernicola]|uniref:Alpha/Beta hydrolase protein n=1 Tax=Aspergillus cavernicola TaxID=176166 RepID=A0ABR4IDJ7_9EURO